MRKSVWLPAVLLLLVASGARSEPFYAFNAVDFFVPADELDAAAVGQAAVHSGFFPLSENDPRLRAAREAPDKAYEIWELRSHKVASIALTRLGRTGNFQVMFTAKDPSRRGAPLSGEACKRWLKFSGAMRLAFQGQRPKFKFRNPQCDP